MSKVDLSVIITLHGESLLASAAIQSAELAIQQLADTDLKIERIFSFDNATDKCRNYFSEGRFPDWKRFEFSFGDQGLARNAVIEQASGKWLALLDGDDLFSENWLRKSMEAIRTSEDQKLILHPELNYYFDAARSVMFKPSQTDELFTPYYFYVSNYYDALSVGPRDAWLEHPYPPRAIKDGYAYEDWQWAIETMSAGYKHINVPDTIIFKRRREASQTLESSGRGARIRYVDALAIDQIKKLGTSG